MEDEGTGAIWMNKLFFGCVALLAVYLLLGGVGWVDDGCTSDCGAVDLFITRLAD